MSYVAFAPGVEVEGIFTFSNGVKLEIHKRESEELAYKLGIRYLGVDKRERDSWKIEIDGELPKHSRGGMTYNSSKKFEFQPYGRDGIPLNTLKL